MTKYRIVGATPDATGLVELPDDARIIGALYHPMNGELNVVILQRASPPKTPEETKKKVTDLPASTKKKTAKEA